MKSHRRKYPNFICFYILSSSKTVYPFETPGYTERRNRKKEEKGASTKNERKKHKKLDNIQNLHQEIIPSPISSNETQSTEQLIEMQKESFDPAKELSIFDSLFDDDHDSFFNDQDNNNDDFDDFC